MFASRHFDKHTKGAGRWNGRQIRNAFQIATSLAFYDMRKSWLERRRTNPDAKLDPPVLSHVQFIKVAQATLKFENYMNEARGGDDEDLARIAHTRADDRNMSEEPSSMSPPSQQPRRGREDRELRQGPRWFGAPPQTPGSGRRRSSFQEELSQYEQDQGNSHDDPYGMGDGRDPRDTRTPTKSERPVRDDANYGFDIPNQGGSWEQNAGHKDQSQEYSESSQGYRDQGQSRDESFGSLNPGSGARYQGHSQGRNPPRPSQFASPGDQRPPQMKGYE